jgi:hypothetical protein
VVWTEGIVFTRQAVKQFIQASDLWFESHNNLLNHLGRKHFLHFIGKETEVLII